MADDLILANSVPEVISSIKKGYTVLAGGTEINRLNSSVVHKGLVSIGRIEGLDSILEVTLEDGNKYIGLGATCTFQEVIDSPIVPDYFKNACLGMSSRTKRNMATIGGNLASVRDDSYLWPVVIACCSKMRVVSLKGRDKLINSVDYLSDYDNLYEDLITELLIPQEVEVVSKRYANTASSHSYISMAIGKSEEGLSIGLCVKNVGLFEAYNTDDLEKVKFKDDMFGSKEYKKYLLKVTAEDLVKELEG